MKLSILTPCTVRERCFWSSLCSWRRERCFWCSLCAIHGGCL